jgi:hypothetical protein
VRAGRWFAGLWGIGGALVWVLVAAGSFWLFVAQNELIGEGPQPDWCPDTGCSVFLPHWPPAISATVLFATGATLSLVGLGALLRLLLPRLRLVVAILGSVVWSVIFASAGVLGFGGQWLCWRLIDRGDGVYQIAGGSRGTCDPSVFSAIGVGLSGVTFAVALALLVWSAMTARREPGLSIRTAHA